MRASCVFKFLHVCFVVAESPQEPRFLVYGYATAFLACLNFQCNRCDRPHGFKVCSPIYVCLSDCCLADKHMSLCDPADEPELELSVRAAAQPHMLQRHRRKTHRNLLERSESYDAPSILQGGIKDHTLLSNSQAGAGKPPSDIKAPPPTVNSTYD